MGSVLPIINAELAWFSSRALQLSMQRLEVVNLHGERSGLGGLMILPDHETDSDFIPHELRR